MPASRCSFRPASEADLPFLVALRVATMALHFERQGIPVSDDAHRERAAFGLADATIVECDGQPVGVIKVLQDGRTWTIDQLQILPAYQRRGLGTALLRAVIREARQAGALLHLSVLKANPAARLYARLGFRTLGESAQSYKMTFIDTVDEL